MSDEINIEETPIWKHLKCSSEVCNALLLGLGCVGLRVDELENFVKWRSEDFGNVKGVIIMYNIDPSQRNLTKEIRSDPESLFFASAVIDETSLLAGILNVVYNSGLCELETGQKLIEHRMLPDPIGPILNGFAILNNTQFHKVNNTVARLKFAVDPIGTFNHSEVIIPFENQVYGLDCSRGTISNLNREVEPHNWFAKIADKLACSINVFHEQKVAFTMLIVVTDIKHAVKLKLEELHGEIQMNGVAKTDKLLEMSELENAFTRNYLKGQFLFDNLVCYSDEQRILINMLHGETRHSRKHKSISYTRRQFLKRTTRAYEVLLQKRALKKQKGTEAKNSISQQQINERLGYPRGKPVKVMKSKQTMLAAKGQKAIQALEKKTKEINAAISKQKNDSQLNTSKRANKSQVEDDDTVLSKNTIKKERKNTDDKKNKAVNRDVVAMKLDVMEENEVRNIIKGEQVIIADNNAANLNKKKIFLQHVSEASVILLQSVPKKEAEALEKMINESASMVTQGKYSVEKTSPKSLVVNEHEAEVKKKQSKFFSSKGKKAISTNNDKTNETLAAVNDLEKTKIRMKIRKNEVKGKKDMEVMKTGVKESKIQMNVEKVKEEEKTDKELRNTDLKEEVIQVYEEKSKAKYEVGMIELKKGIKIEHSFEDGAISNEMKMENYFVLGTEKELSSKELEDRNEGITGIENDAVSVNNSDERVEEEVISDKLKSKTKFCEIAKVNTFISCGISDISTLAKEASMFALGIPLD